jgi:hypothetical protein
MLHEVEGCVSDELCQMGGIVRALAHVEFVQGLAALPDHEEEG